MEKVEKELKVQIPEGYEIDEDKSTFEKIVFKQLKSNPKTFREVEEYLVFDKDCPVISFRTAYASEDLFKSLMALRKLCNVAEYLNGGWIPPRSRYNQRWFIGLTFEDAKSDKISINIMKHNSVQYSCIYFKSRELAEQAIQILGEDTIIQALTLNH